MNYAVLYTPIGFFKITQNGEYITNIDFIDKYIQSARPETELLKEACHQITEYFNGNLKTFSLPLQINTTPFRKSVLTQLLNVQYGETITYKELARRIGNPKSVRAVGSAMRTNPLPIIIPCHRVLPSKGGIGNYSAGGQANKEWLLCFEKQNI